MARSRALMTLDAAIDPSGEYLDIAHHGEDNSSN